MLNIVMQNKNLISDLPSNLSGYEEFDDFVVQEFRQGDRVHYTVVVSLAQCVQLFPIPDPLNPFEDNRQVNAKRAELFAKYVRGFLGWHAGALTIRTTSGLVSFDESLNYGRIRIGTLRVPKGRSKEFAIVDGQHRILGLKALFDALAADRTYWLQTKQTAEKNADKQTLELAKEELAQIESDQDRIRGESVLVNLIVEDDAKSARQLFVDVADNALGVPKAVRSRFDQTKVANRALYDVLTKPPEVLKNRVDDQKDRVMGKNSNLIGAGNLSEIIRTLEVGISGRINKKLESELSETHLVNQTNDFFKALTDAFIDLQHVADGVMSTEALRDTSLLGSSTMLRILAGVYHEISRTLGKASAASFLSKLAPHMSAPIDPATPSGQLWTSCGSTDAFVAGDRAPGARAQQVKDAVASITSWIDSPPEQL